MDEIPTLYISEMTMRTILACSVLILVFCVGCPTETPEPTLPPATSPEGTPEKPKLVEPLVPKVDDPPEGTPETTMILSEALGKYAAEVVPLPPIEDLTAQVDAYITDLGKSLDALDGSPKYADDAANVVRDANALTLVALAIGLSEDDSPYKKAATSIIAATHHLAAAKNLDEGQKAYEALKTSLKGSGDGTTLSWSGKVAELEPVMKAVPNLSSAVKRITDTERKFNTALKNRAQSIYSQLAALAVLAQGSIPAVEETSSPDAKDEWKTCCEEFRDAALKVNAAARQFGKDTADGKEPNYAAFSTSFKAMTEACDSCHKIFHPSAVGQTE
jgi:cytochrome c556